MSFEDFAVFSFLFCYLVEISMVFQTLPHVVVGPLRPGMNDECVSKEFCVMFVGGGALASGSRGRATPWMRKWFDCTKGYPGEDVFLQPCKS